MPPPPAMPAPVFTQSWSMPPPPVKEAPLLNNPGLHSQEFWVSMNLQGYGSNHPDYFKMSSFCGGAVDWSCNNDSGCVDSDPLINSVVRLPLRPGPVSTHDS